MIAGRDISPNFRFNKTDALTIRKILPHEAKPEAIKVFARYAWRLSDYAYWFLLGTLWVSHVDGTDLDLWIRLFSSNRRNRTESLMKHSELEALGQFPDTIWIYRAHNPGESRWISYSQSADIAADFAARKGVHEISAYQVQTRDVFALFLRRKEFEVLVLDSAKVAFRQFIPVIAIKDIASERDRAATFQPIPPAERQLFE